MWKAVGEARTQPSREIIVITATSTARAAGTGRTRGELAGAKRPPPGAQSEDYALETELSKLIRYGCQFELEVHQMAELSQLRAENLQLKRSFQNGSAGARGGRHS
jgi:hypothetical protein